MELVEVDRKLSGLEGGDVAFWVDSQVRVIALIGKEGGDASGGIRGIVVRKFCERKEFGPIGLLIVAINADILFECLVDSLGLAVAFWMVAGGEVEVDVEEGAKGAEEVGDKLRTTVRGDMVRDSMFGEYMGDKESCEFLRGTFIVGWDEDCLFGESVNYYQYGSVLVRRWELLDKVHGN